MASPGAAAHVPYWRLSGLYFFYFTVVGAIMPYWTLYLKDRGFDALEIGWLSAILFSTRIVAPNIWGWLADHYGRRVEIVRGGALAGFLIFLGVFPAQGFSGLALVIFGFSFFWNAIIAQFEVITLAYLGAERKGYSQIRVWGSVGFIVAVLLLGVTFDYVSIARLPVFIAGFMFCIWVSSLVLPNAPEEQSPAPATRLSSILRQPSMIAFFCVTVLLQVSHAPYYVFFSVYLDENGYARTLIGQLWALGVVAEIGMFMLMHRLMHHFSIRGIILFSLLCTGLRWYLSAYYVDHLPVLVVAQCLHAFSFGCMHACSVEVVHRFFGGAHSGKGQALYSAASYGVGAAIGAGLAGYLWVSPGPTGAYLAAMAVAGLAWLVAWVWLRSEQFA